MDTGLILPGKKSLIAPDWVEEIDWAANEIKVNLSAELIRNSPQYNPDTPIDRAYEEGLYHHMKKTAYWQKQSD